MSLGALCRSRASLTAVAKSAAFLNQYESKSREGTEVQRWAHLLDKTLVLMTCFVVKRERMLMRIDSGKMLIRSSKVGACLRRLVQ